MLGAWPVMVVLVVLSASSMVRMSCAAALYVSLKSLERAQILSDRLVARIQLQQNLIRVGDRLTDPLALAADAFGERGQHAR